MGKEAGRVPKVPLFDRPKLWWNEGSCDPFSHLNRKKACFCKKKKKGNGNSHHSCVTFTCYQLFFFQCFEMLRVAVGPTMFKAGNGFRKSGDLPDSPGNN